MKSDQLKLLCMLDEQGKDWPPNLPKTAECPQCSKDIKLSLIITGKCDIPWVPGKWFKRHLGEFALLAMLISAIVLKFLFKWSLVPSIFVGIIAGAAAATILIPILDSLSLVFRKR